MSTPTARLNPHLIRLPRFDHDIGHAELGDYACVGDEMAGRPRHREGGGAGRKRQRHQQLIGEVKLDRGIRRVMRSERGRRFVGHRFGWLS